MVSGDSQVLGPTAAKDLESTSTVLSEDGSPNAVSDTIRMAGLRLVSAIVSGAGAKWMMVRRGRREKEEIRPAVVVHIPHTLLCMYIDAE